jgi:hypothetical protein
MIFPTSTSQVARITRMSHQAQLLPDSVSSKTGCGFLALLIIAQNCRHCVKPVERELGAGPVLCCDALRMHDV